MELVKIEELLRKYENAETSIEEEVILKKFFSSADIPIHLKEYQIMFTFFNTSTNETFTKKIEIISSSKNNNRWYSIVASLIILFGIFYGNQEFKKFKERNEAKRTLAKVTEVLKIVSSNLKKGNQALNNLYVYEDTVYKILKKVNIK